MFFKFYNIFGMKHRFVNLLAILAFVPFGLNAQNVEVTGRLSADTIVPGQQFGLELELKTPANISVAWPVFADTLSSAVEIVGRGGIETSPSDEQGNKIMRQQITLTSFDTGWIQIPPIHFGYTPDDDTSGHFLAESNPLMLRVIAMPIDTTSAFRPIKNAQTMPLSFSEILPWLLGFLVLAALVYGILRWWKGRKTAPLAEKEEVVSNVPPHLLALERLEQLRLDRLWQQGQLKEYHTQLSDIVKAYIETEFPVNAVEMTTYEILQALRPLHINAEAMNKLSLALELSDLVKFAKAQPSGMENDMSLNHLVDFVKESHQQKAHETASAETEAAP